MSLTVGNSNNTSYTKNVSFGINPYKPIMDATILDLRQVRNKAIESSKVFGITTQYLSLDRPISTSIASFLLAPWISKIKIIKGLNSNFAKTLNDLMTKHPSTKNLGDLYIAMKKDIIDNTLEAAPFKGMHI